MDLDTHQPLEADIYYNIGSAIFWGNQISCNDLKLYKKLGNYIWDQRVNMGVFGVSIVDTYNVETQSLAYEDTYHAIFYTLS